VYLDGNVCITGHGPGGKFDAIYVDSDEVKVAFVARGKLNFDQRSLVDRASGLRHTADARQYQTSAQLPNALIELPKPTTDVSESPRKAPTPPPAVN
jgi:hypothetical protein